MSPASERAERARRAEWHARQPEWILAIANGQQVHLLSIEDLTRAREREAVELIEEILYEEEPRPDPPEPFVTHGNLLGSKTDPCGITILIADSGYPYLVLLNSDFTCDITPYGESEDRPEERPKTAARLHIPSSSASPARHSIPVTPGQPIRVFPSDLITLTRGEDGNNPLRMLLRVYMRYDPFRRLDRPIVYEDRQYVYRNRLSALDETNHDQGDPLLVGEEGRMRWASQWAEHEQGTDDVESWLKWGAVEEPISRAFQGDKDRVLKAEGSGTKGEDKADKRASEDLIASFAKLTTEATTKPLTPKGKRSAAKHKKK